MKTRIFVLSLVAAALSLSSPSWAQNTPDARKLTLTKEYMELAQVTKMMNSAMGAMANALNLGPDVPPEFAKAMKEAMVESSTAVFPAMMDRMAELYADAYTLEELDAIVAFYKSPAGRSMTVKSEQLIATSVPAMMAEFGPALERDMVDRLCAKLSCTAEQKTEIMKRFSPGVRR